jgi:hypothetical protein
LFQLFSTMRRDADYLKEMVNADLRSNVGGEPQTRVVPKWKTIKDIPGVMPCEDIREILKAYDGRLSTSQRRRKIRTLAQRCRVVFP